MRKKIFLIISFLVLLLAFEARAGDIAVANFSIVEVGPHIVNEPMTLKAILASDTNVSIFSIIMYVDGKQFYGNAYSIDANQPLTLNVAYNPTQAGFHTAKIFADYLPDANAANNVLDFNFFIYSGKNMLAKSLSFTTTQPKQNEPIGIITEYSNAGDIIAENVKNCIVINNTIHSCWQDTLLPSQTAQHAIIVNAINATITLALNIDGQIKEYSYTDNNLTRQMIVFFEDLPDFEVLNGLITLAQEPYLGVENAISVKVRNAGDANAFNVITRILLDGILIGSTTIDIPKGGKAEVKTPFLPQKLGSTLISVTIDANNFIPEKEENNNYAERTIVVKSKLTDYNAILSYTVDFFIRKTCQALISNGDRIMILGVDTNSIMIRIVDNLGETIFDGNLVDGNELVMWGRTMKVLSIEANTARVLLVYPQQVAVVFNECTINIDFLISENALLTNNYATCQDSLRSISSRFDGCKKSVDDTSEILKSCRLDFENIVQKNRDCINDVMQKDGECAEKVDVKEKQKIFELEMLKQDFSVQKSEITTFAIVGFILFFAHIILDVLFIVVIKKGVF